MGLSEALRGYERLMSMCPACRRAAIEAGKRYERNCRAGKHVKAKGVLTEGPPI